MLWSTWNFNQEFFLVSRKPLFFFCPSVPWEFGLFLRTAAQHSRSFSDQVDRLEEKESTFFAQCLSNLKKEENEKEYQKIKEGYKKAIEDATEKVQVAEDCYGLGNIF